MAAKDTGTIKARHSRGRYPAGSRFHPPNIFSNSSRHDDRTLAARRPGSRDPRDSTNNDDPRRLRATTTTPRGILHRARTKTGHATKTHHATRMAHATKMDLATRTGPEDTKTGDLRLL